MNDLSGCFLPPGKSVSSCVIAIMEEFLTLSTPALERCRLKGRSPGGNELGCEVEMKEIADLIMRRAGELVEHDLPSIVKDALPNPYFIPPSQELSVVYDVGILP
jgi:hypothetical protein